MQPRLPVPVDEVNVWDSSYVGRPMAVTGRTSKDEARQGLHPRPLGLPPQLAVASLIPCWEGVVVPRSVTRSAWSAG